MFVSMWMTQDVLTVGPDTPLSDIAKTMTERHIRRVPVVNPNGDLCGLVSSHDVLHAFPASVNPFAYLAGKEAAIPPLQILAKEVMVTDPLTVSPETPIEEAARLMCDHKVGALLVVRRGELVGLITESDVFRAFTSLFDPGTHGVRICFDNSNGSDVFPLVAELTHQHRLRVMSFVSLHKHQRPMCVVQVTGTEASIEAMLNAIWRSHHQVLSVIHLEAAEAKA